MGVLHLLVLFQLLLDTSSLLLLRGLVGRHASSAPPLKALLKEEERLVDIYRKAVPSVVFISTLNRAFNPVLFNVLEVPSKSGSGFVWGDRFIVTNAHVVEAGRAGGDEVTNAKFLVTFAGGYFKGASFRARVKGIDRERDVAVLEVVEDGDGKPLTLGGTANFQALERGSSAELSVGQYAIAIGNPFGLDLTMTKGIVSGLGRTIGVGRGGGGGFAYDMLQLDAAINPGNSGGPLLDSSGNLIGMNTAIYTTSGSSSGVGFAIPVDNLKIWVSLLLRDGMISSPKTGLRVVGGYAARALGFPKGLVVAEVERGSPGSAAGIRAATGGGARGVGDVILQINGVDVDTEADMGSALSAMSLQVPATSVCRLVVSRAVGSAGGAGGAEVGGAASAERRTVALNMQIL